jgi:hypothetical protein
MDDLQLKPGRTVSASCHIRGPTEVSLSDGSGLHAIFSITVVDRARDFVIPCVLDVIARIPKDIGARTGLDEAVACTFRTPSIL